MEELHFVHLSFYKLYEVHRAKGCIHWLQKCAWNWLTTKQTPPYARRIRFPPGGSRGEARGGRAPLLLDQTEARRAKNLFLRPGPLPSGSVWPAPSPPYLKVWIRFWNKMIFITRLTKSCLRIKSYFVLVSVSIEVLHFSTLSLGMLISHGGIP